MLKDKNIVIKNVYYMLSYAFQSLDQSNYKDIKAEDFENVHNLFAAILSKGIGQQLKQGLYREYLSNKEDLSVVRGKIDISGTMQKKIAHQRVLTCEYDELSENNVLNQIIKTTVLILLRHSQVDDEYKGALKKEMLFFANVDVCDPTQIKWASIHFLRNNQTYRMLIGMCQLVLEGMLLTTEDGGFKLASFIDSQQMSRLYEKFILEYYRKKYPGLRPAASQIPWALDDGFGTLLPTMQSDITLTQGSTVLIIDAKYYSQISKIYFDASNYRSNNLYQIFTYVKNKDSELDGRQHKVSGMLLYAQTDGYIPTDSIYQMSGNQISVKTLDLNCEFSEIVAQLNAIIEDHFEIVGV